MTTISIICMHILNFFILVCISLVLTACGFFSSSPLPPPLPAKAHKVVKTAYTQIGKQYRLGGSSPTSGFDCSGLIWWAYKQHGIKVPRITSDQAKIGKSIPRKKMRSGDIMVFRTASGPRGLHTGLYAGSRSFIHSPRSGKKVCMEYIDNSYWKKNLIAIRRVTK